MLAWKCVRWIVEHARQRGKERADPRDVPGESLADDVDTSWEALVKSLGQS